jgi:Kef-type K+ transport system membrane component KefB
MAVSATIAGFSATILFAIIIRRQTKRMGYFPPPLSYLLGGMLLAALWPLIPVEFIGIESEITTTARTYFTTLLGLLVVLSAGLALPLIHLRERFKPIAKISFVKILPPLLLLPAVSVFLWPDAGAGAIVVGVALSEVSVAISWSMLDAHNRMNSRIGKDLLGVTFLVNSTVVILTLFFLQTSIVLITILFFMAGIVLHNQISQAIKLHFRSFMRIIVTPLFFVFAGARIDWSAVIESYAWLLLLLTGIISRVALPKNGASKILDCSIQDARYFDALSVSRSTFAVLILSLGATAGVIQNELLSQSTVIISLLAAFAAILAHRVHIQYHGKESERTPE